MVKTEMPMTPNEFKKTDLYQIIQNLNRDTFESTVIKLYRQNVPISFNQACLNEWLLPN